MVRPIEISDSMTKAEAVQRLQQNIKMQPEAVQQFQKALTEKLPEQVNMPNPVPRGDEVVIHVSRRDEEKQRQMADQEKRDDDKEHHTPEEERIQGRDDDTEHPRGHIDITI